MGKTLGSGCSGTIGFISYEGNMGTCCDSGTTGFPLWWIGSGTTGSPEIESFL